MQTDLSFVIVCLHTTLIKFLEKNMLESYFKNYKKGLICNTVSKQIAM